MTKRILLAATAVATFAAAAPASAVTVITQQGTLANFAAPYGGSPTTKTFTFNNAGATDAQKTSAAIAEINAAGFTVTSTGTFGVRSSSMPGQWQQPTPGDLSSFASVQNNSSVSIFTSSPDAMAYNYVSLYVGSIDTYNSIAVLNRSGQVIQSFTGAQLVSFATPAGTANGTTSYRITFVNDGGEAFGGVRVVSTSNNAAEFDNLVFAVPEPSTWALMLAGFGLVGMSMRARRRRTTVVFG